MSVCHNVIVSKCWGVANWLSAKCCVSKCRRTCLGTLVLGYSASKLAFGHHRRVGWLWGLRPSAIKILTLLAVLAAGGYVWPFGPNESLILLKTTHIFDSRPHYTALSCPAALYSTPPSILTLLTWIQRVQAGLWPSPHVTVTV